MEADGVEFLHVEACDCVQGVAPQGAAFPQALVPHLGPGLHALLNAAQDLLVVGRRDLGAIVPVHLQGAHTTQDQRSLHNRHISCAQIKDNFNGNFHHKKAPSLELGLVHIIWRTELNCVFYTESII